MGTQAQTATATSACMKVSVTFTKKEAEGFEAKTAGVDLESQREVRALFTGDMSPEESITLMSWLRVEKGVPAQKIPLEPRQAVGPSGLNTMFKARAVRMTEQAAKQTSFTSQEVDKSPQHVDASAVNENPFKVSN